MAASGVVAPMRTVHVVPDADMPAGHDYLCVQSGLTVAIFYGAASLTERTVEASQRTAVELRKGSTYYLRLRSL